jgi:hypothetical protein
MIRLDAVSEPLRDSLDEAAEHAKEAHRTPVLT